MPPKSIDRIYWEAAQLQTEPERDVYLAQACGEDVKLRQRVEELLQVQSQAHAFLEDAPPALLATIDAPIQEGPGTVIGSYKLLEQIGEGGFGVVFMAEQMEPIRRKVALKILKPGMDTKQVIARFEAERQALALMDHPNIAHVHDGGATESGRPYFVMELVKGVPITEYCDAQKLDTRERLQLFLQVCQAVQHAHQKGIIHRDIKPSNVLVTLRDGTPVVKVIDFGIAKAMSGSLTDKSLFTGFAQMIGTPLYMSPEQAGMSELDVDTRSDIYSLGVLLYELLTGTTPFDREALHKAGFDEIRRIIREDEPLRPSNRISTLRAEQLSTVCDKRKLDGRKLSQHLRGELDWIVMKCLEKDRRRRYETASSLATDVQRYLHDEPVQACPPSVVYRLRKFVRRNKTAVMMLSVVVMAVLLVVGSIGWMARDRVAREQELAHEQAARRARVVERITPLLAQVEMLEQERKWPEALAFAKQAEAALASGEADASMEKRVRQAVAALELVHDLEEIRLRAAELYKGTEVDHERVSGLYAEAFRRHGADLKALSVEDAAAQLRSRPGVAVALAQALDGWAWCRLKLKDKPEGRKLLALAWTVDPDQWRTKVRQAVAHDDFQALARLAESEDSARQPPPYHILLARSIAKGGDTLAVRVLERAAELYPDDFWIHFDLAQANSHFRSRGPKRFEVAIHHYIVARALRPRSAGTWINLANALKDSGRVNEAISCARKAVELAPSWSLAHTTLGGALRDQGKLDEAIACHKKAIKLDPNDAVTYSNLGHALRDKKNLDEAIACYKKAIKLDPKLARAYSGLGSALADQHKLAEAIPYFKKAIELDPMYAVTHNNLGLALQNQKKLNVAVGCFRKAIELDPELLEAHNNLGTSLVLLGKPAEAIIHLRKAIELNPNDGEVHFNLGVALEKLGKAREAVAAFKETIRLMPNFAPGYNQCAWILATCPEPEVRNAREAVKLAKKLVELTPKDGGHWNTLGVAYYRAGEWKQALAALARSSELQGDNAFDGFFVAMTHWQLSNKGEARKRFDWAVGWMEKHAPRNPELRRFRAEAAALLGVEETKK